MATTSSNKQRCAHCGAEEYIPFTQYVKFDDKVQYLCKKCWDAFRTWFFARFAAKP